MKKYIILSIIAIAIISIQASFMHKEPSNKAELGELLFFDSILSKDRTVSCASCHRPAYAFADTSPVSLGVKGKKGMRNTPTAMNVLLHQTFFLGWTC